MLVLIWYVRGANVVKRPSSPQSRFHFLDRYCCTTRPSTTTAVVVSAALYYLLYRILSYTKYLYYFVPGILLYGFTSTSAVSYYYSIILLHYSYLARSIPTTCCRRSRSAGKRHERSRAWPGVCLREKKNSIVLRYRCHIIQEGTAPALWLSQHRI